MKINIDRAVVLSVDERYDPESQIKWKIRGKFPVLLRNIQEFVCGKGEYNVEYNQIDTPEELIPSYWKDGPFGKLTNSYCAFRCFQKIIEQAKQDKVEQLLILEDDFLINDNFLDIYSKIEQQVLNFDWDMLYFGANHSWSPTKQVSENLLKLYGSLCWHSVLLRNTVFDEILRWKPIKPIDTMAAQFLHNKYLCLGVWPSIVIQKPGHSYVEKKYRDYSEFWKCKGNPAL